MLETARYEARLLERVVEVMRREQGELCKKLVSRRGAGVGSSRLNCALCNKPLAGHGQVILFPSCRHVFHSSCLLAAHGKTSWVCVLCSSPASSPASSQAQHSQPGLQAGGEARQRERVEKDRQFLKVYSRDGQSGPFTQESIIKSETFPLRLKPAGK